MVGLAAAMLACLDRRLRHAPHTHRVMGLQAPTRPPRVVVGAVAMVVAAAAAMMVAQ